MQRTLFNEFDDHERAKTPLPVRRNDPETSHDAAKHAQSSGLIGRQQAAALAFIQRHQGYTTKELATLPGAPLDRYQFGRRVAELAKRGLVRRVKVDGRDGLVIYSEGHR